MLEAEVPAGMVAGSQFIVRAPNGTSLRVTLPPGLSPGDKFHVAIPEEVEAEAEAAVIMHVEVPEGVFSGQDIIVQAPNGVQVRIRFPRGTAPGSLSK